MPRSLDDQLSALLNEDIAAAMSRERTAFDESIGDPRRDLVLFGAGRLGRLTLRGLRAHGIEPVAFSDNNQALWGSTIDGVTVLSPADAARLHGRSGAFVVTIFNPDSTFASLRAQLSRLSCEIVVSFIPLFWKYAVECLPHMAVDLPHRILQHRDEIWWAYSLLGDDLSRCEYVSQIRWRLSNDYDGLLPPAHGDQYFPDDLFTLIPDEVVIDCGAFDGDTIRHILKRRSDFRQILAFEPDPTNFKLLQEYTSGLPETFSKRIMLRRLALGSEKGQILFEALAAPGSKASQTGSLVVECDTLDSIVSDWEPTYVKMDIEGSECDAIRGAQGIMTRASPIWAVCVYHLPEDIWRVPLSLASLCHNYRFFLRKYRTEVWETVCYAIPAGRLAKGAPAYSQFSES